MTKFNSQIEDTLSLVEQNLEFLHVGMFLNYYIKNNNLSSEVEPIEYKFDSGRSYILTGQLAKDALLAYFDQNKPTVFGYLVMWNSCRGISMAMREGLKDDSIFKEFLKQKLDKQYEHYYAILCFIRNQLSHNIQNEIQLKESDYKDTCKAFLKKCPSASGVASFFINYTDTFPELNLPRNYEFKIEIDFNLLSPGKRFIEVVSEFHLFMFSELCFYFVSAFRKTQK